jgi:hypothetical protein
MNRFTESLVKYAAPFALASTVAACDDTVNQDFDLPDRVETADAGTISDIQDSTLRTTSRALTDTSSLQTTTVYGEEGYLHCLENGGPVIQGGILDSPIGEKLGETSESEGVFSIWGTRQIAIGPSNPTDLISTEQFSEILPLTVMPDGGNAFIFYHPTNPEGNLYTFGTIYSNSPDGPFSDVDPEINGPDTSASFESNFLIYYNYKADIVNGPDDRYTITNFTEWTEWDDSLSGSVMVISFASDESLPVNFGLTRDGDLWDIETGQELSWSRRSTVDMSNLYEQHAFSTPIVDSNGEPFIFQIGEDSRTDGPMSFYDLINTSVIAFNNNSGNLGGVYRLTGRDGSSIEDNFRFTISFDGCKWEPTSTTPDTGSDAGTESDADTDHSDATPVDASDAGTDSSQPQPDATPVDASDAGTDTSQPQPDATQVDASDAGTDSSQPQPDTTQVDDSDAGNTDTSQPQPDGTPNTTADSGAQNPDNGTPDGGTSVNPLEIPDEGEVTQEEPAAPGGCSVIEQDSSQPISPEESTFMFGLAASLLVTKTRKRIADFFKRK